MAIIEVSGTAAGTSTAVGAIVVLYHTSVALAGDASVAAEGGRLRIVTGQIQGASTAEINIFKLAAGTAEGTSVVTGNASRVALISGRVLGTSRLVWSTFMPIYGRATMVAHMVVERVLPAIQATTAPYTTFRYMQLLQRGDLPLYIYDSAGPVTPVWVRFTMYQRLYCGARRQVGPAQRVPVLGEVGEHYAVGRAGEGGQPGVWEIFWEYRGNLHSATQSTTMTFRVQDAVAAADPRDTTIRYRKFGWT